MSAEYTAACQQFDWRAVRGALGWGEAHAVDLARTIIDRHRDSARTALVFIDQQGRESRHSYAELAEQSDRAANLLARLGVRPGDRVVFTHAALRGQLPAMLPGRASARTSPR